MIHRFIVLDSGDEVFYMCGVGGFRKWLISSKKNGWLISHGNIPIYKYYQWMITRVVPSYDLGKLHDAGENPRKIWRFFVAGMSWESWDLRGEDSHLRGIFPACGIDGRSHSQMRVPWFSGIFTYIETPYLWPSYVCKYSSTMEHLGLGYKPTLNQNPQLWKP